MIDLFIATAVKASNAPFFFICLQIIIIIINHHHHHHHSLLRGAEATCLFRAPQCGATYGSAHWTRSSSADSPELWLLAKISAIFERELLL
jgi:hypothetical protein